MRQSSTKAVEALELNKSDTFWRPLVLFIPLRLGLTEINPLYYRALKSTFAFPQTLGILGGRPNHALFIIGCVGDDLVYLDPHTTQPAINIADDVQEFIPLPQAAQQEDDESSGNFTMEMDDTSYHCKRASRMPISHLDPSLALGFLFETERHFNEWANLTLKKLIQEEQQPLFEIMKERPANWPMFEEDFDLAQSRPGPSNVPATYCLTGRESGSSTATHSNENSSFTALESDEDYEIID